MTSVPRLAMKRNDTRKYSLWSWIKGYTAWACVLPIYLGLWAFATVFKRIPEGLRQKLLREHIRYTVENPMDFRIPPNTEVPAYMHRWWRIARNAYMNVYYHIVLRSDDDRALHDHPWWNFSIVLEGGYFEHTIDAGGVNHKIWYGPGSVRFRRAGTYAHRLELDTRLERVGFKPVRNEQSADGMLIEHGDPIMEPRELAVTTIFITGPVLRRWGFHHPERWVDAYDWDAFMAERGIEGMKMDGGSDAAVSPRNLI